MGDPTLSWHNFSFRKEAMGAPEGQEVIHGSNENVEIFPKKAAPPAKKTSPAKKTEKPAESTPKLTNPLFKSEPGSAKSGGKTGGKPGGLKIKMFSKMNEKNSIGASPRDSEMPLDSSPSASISPASVPIKMDSSPPPSTSITPTPRASASRPTASTSSAQAWAAGASPALPSGQKPVLQPTHSRMVSCSIHCPGVQGFPSLSCVSCHSMFHPVCVGLMDGLDFASKFDFFCAQCKPLT